jgi:hypothetical protein
MISVSTVVVAVFAALAYRYMVNRQKKTTPDALTGPQDHDPMPEMKYVQPLEINEFNASKFVVTPGTGIQIGAFSQTV